MPLSGNPLRKILLIPLGFLVLGCSQTPAPTPPVVTANALTPGPKTSATEKALPPKSPPKRVTNRPANTKGVIPILMYHRVLEKEARYDRSYENFGKDLDALYRQGYRPITLSQYVDKKIDIAPGATPVIITFDDSDPTQFDLLPDGKINPKTAYGIMKKFEGKYPDFKARAVFFVNPYRLFGKRAQGISKLKMLQDLGNEIGSHTWKHDNLRKLTDAQVAADFKKTNEFLRKNGIVVRTLAPPYGVMPKNKALLKQYDAVVLAGSEPAPSCFNPKRNLRALPRVWAYNGSLGIKDWMARLKVGKPKPFVQP